MRPSSCRRSGLSEIERAAVEAELNAFDIALGACERIVRQAIPMAYTRWGPGGSAWWLVQGLAAFEGAGSFEGAGGF